MLMNSSLNQVQTDVNPFALFISDLHLQASRPLTTAAFLRFLKQQALRAKQLYLLGDIFEYWAGDDDLITPFNRDIAAAIADVANSGVAVFWIAGNRDFLVAQDFAQAAGLTLLSDPHVITVGDTRLTLAHGDAQCSDDVDYMAFRAQVRNPVWQQGFLALPLAQRKAIIEGLRQGSQTAQQTKSEQIMDVNQAAIARLFADTDSHILIHGHTHRPACHIDHTDTGLRMRYVLPDWELDDTPLRGGWIALQHDGRLQRIDYQGQILNDGL